MARCKTLKEFVLLNEKLMLEVITAEGFISKACIRRYERSSKASIDAMMEAKEHTPHKQVAEALALYSHHLNTRFAPALPHKIAYMILQ